MLKTVFTISSLLFVPLAFFVFDKNKGAQEVSKLTKTANDFVPPYTGYFGYGSNMGFYQPYQDEDIADLAHNVGVTCLRPAYYAFFAEQWGYDIRANAFKHYEDLGMTDNVCFVGYPSAAQRDNTIYCGKDSSTLFANMYEPIWDDGKDGTPINEKNDYAHYLYKVVKQYDKQVKFWEVWNEPDYATTFKTEMAPGLPGAWWNTNPDPCEYALHAPVQHYIRLLRISYEVIKTLSPDDYVCVGGIGFPSFLDVLLRQTDNPEGGKVTPQYPLQGGAYFDVLSYHSYPHIDGSVRSWSDKINGFTYERHSDKAAEGIFRRKNQHEDVLTKYGYDGTKYPKKHFIITECNIPAERVGEYMGSEEVQRNFLMKALVLSQKKDVKQFYVYALAELQTEKPRNEFDRMGLFPKIEGTSPKTKPAANASGIAFHTMANILRYFRYNSLITKSLDLPENADGAVFENDKGKKIAVLWAKTSKDLSEEAAVFYTLPKVFSNPKNNTPYAYELRHWDFSVNPKSAKLSAGTTLRLTATPVLVEIL